MITEQGQQRELDDEEQIIHEAFDFIRTHRDAFPLEIGAIVVSPREDLPYRLDDVVGELAFLSCVVEETGEFKRTAIPITDVFDWRGLVDTCVVIKLERLMTAEGDS